MALQGHNRGPGVGGWWWGVWAICVGVWAIWGGRYGKWRYGKTRFKKKKKYHNFITILCHVGFSILQVI